MPKLNQKGVIHLLVPLLLIGGIIVTVYLVTAGPLKLFPKAASGPISVPITSTPTPTPIPTPTPTPTPKPPLSLTANPLSITKKGVVTLTWNFTQKLTGCTFSRDANGITMAGGWSGKLSKAELTLGSHTKKLTLSNTSKIVRTTTFNITCKIADIVNGASVNVTVRP